MESGSDQHEDQLIQQIDPVPRAPRHEDGVVESRPIQQSFPTLLAELRAQRRWNKADLAKHAGFDPSTITRLEKGAREPERETVMALAEALGVNPIDRDRLLAAAGYRSTTWDDPDLVQLAVVLADASIPTSVREEIRTTIRVALSHGRLARMQPAEPADT